MASKTPWVERGGDRLKSVTADFTRDTINGRNQDGKMVDLRRTLGYVRWRIRHSDPKISKFVWGPGGIGKSTMVKELAEELKCGFVELRLSEFDRPDLLWPKTDKETGRVSFEPVDILPRVDRDGGFGILFLDEMNQAPPDVQKAAYQLILNRRIGTYTLPDGWNIIAAGNRAQDVGGVTEMIHEMSGPLKNRFIHLYVDPPKNDEAVADMAGWMHRNNIHPAVTGFLAWCGQSGKYDLIHEDKSAHLTERWPSPRSWEFASQELQQPGYRLVDPVSGDITIAQNAGALLKDVVASAVGDAAAQEFASYLNVYKLLPDARAILEEGLEKVEKGLRGKKIPEEGRPDLLMAFSATMVSALRKLWSENPADSRKQIMANFAEAMMALPKEVALYCFRTVNKLNDRELMSAVLKSACTTSLAVYLARIVRLA